MSTSATHVKWDSVASLRESIVTPGRGNPAYVAKMFHEIPEMPTVKDRGAYLVEKAKDKVVLDIGCTGAISKQIKLAAKKYYGVDKEDGEDIVGVNLDMRPDQMPKFDDVELIIASEVLEHLANPGYFLLALKHHYAGKEMIITVPNAGAYQVKDGCEVVNPEHVCWYSYQTLKALLMRYKYEITLARWFNGEPYKAEGLIMVVQI